jgi:hypothetical protein
MGILILSNTNVLHRYLKSNAILPQKKKRKKEKKEEDIIKEMF